MGIIHGAAKTGDVRAVRGALHRGAAPNEPDKHGRPPLVHAAKNGHTAVAELLLDNGADVNSACIGGSHALSGEIGITALMWACWTGRDEVIALLIRRGANASAVASDGDSALRLARSNGWDPIVAQLEAAGASR